MLLSIVPRAGDAASALTPAWSEWNQRFSISVAEPKVDVREVAAVSLPGKRGRSQNGKIEINGALSPADKVSALRHEAAHAYLQARCPRVVAEAPLVSEAFALHVTGEAARFTYDGSAFPYASSARDYLVHLSIAKPADDSRSQAALSRVLASSEQRAGWESYFRSILGKCGESAFSLAHAGEQFRSLSGGSAAPDVPISLDFLLVDGLSNETLVREGRPDEKRPLGSLLKPTFFGSVPELMDSRPAENNALWDCGSRRKPGELWTWQKALLKSCNGFFLSRQPPSSSWERWNESMKALDIWPLPHTMGERIGLIPTITLNLPEIIRLYAWLQKTSPFVIETLKRTAVEGTLAGLPDSAWFVQRGISLKTGTVSDVRGVVSQAWIVAVGPRDEAGNAAYFAVLRSRGLSTHELLGKLKERLRASLKYPSRAVDVQVLGLLPSVTVALSCRSRVPLLQREENGRYRILKSGTTLSSNDLKTGESYRCLGDALRIKMPSGTRDYWGGLKVTAQLPESERGDLPKDPRAARARQGSRLVLTTSERHYVVDTMLSEFPNGHTELLRALALVVRHNARVPRHGARPLCDTTHCQIFGRGGDAPQSQRRKIEAIVDDTAPLSLSADTKTWLPFHFGGLDAWSTKLGESQIRVGLNVQEHIRQILKTDQETVELVSDSGRKKLPCEVVRNQLKLLSCPDSVSSTSEGWVFRGKGEGHGLGLDLTVANVRAGAGESHAAILEKSYPKLRVVAAGN